MKSLPPEQLSKVARDIAGNLIFTSNHIREGDGRLINNIFMPAMLGAFADMTDEEMEDIGMLYEYYSEAAQMSVNGYPIFFSMRMMNKADAAEVFKKVKVLKEVMDMI